MASHLPCEGKYCGKGLKVKLSRFFPVTKGKGQEVSAALTKDFPVLGEGYHYSVSTLRPGYFYVFNDARGSWDGYFITETKQPKLLRFLANLSDKQVVVPKFLATQRYAQYDAKFFASCECNKETKSNKPGSPKKLEGVIVDSNKIGAVALAGANGILVAQGKPPAKTGKHEELVNINTITLEGDSSQFTSVYFAYSDTEWTAENFKKIIKARSSYMQKADLQKIINKTANDTYNSLLVHDRMGIAAELNNLAQLEVATFNKNLETNFNHWRCDAVDAIKTAVERGAETEYYDDVLMHSPFGGEIAAIADPAKRQEARDYWRIKLIAGINANTIKGVYASKDHLEKAIAKAWAKYEKDADRGTYNTIRGQTKTKAEATNKKLAVLDGAIAAMLSHSKTLAYINNCFDKNNTDHGIALTGVIGAAMEHTADLEKCSALYKKWLVDESLDNPLWRALTHDDAKLTAEVKKAGAEDGTFEFLVNKLDWKSVFSVYGAWAAGPGEKVLAKRYANKIASGVSGTLSKMVFSNTMPKAASKALFLFGLHGDLNVRMGEVPGMTPLGAARQVLLNTMIAEAEEKAGKSLSNNAKKSIAQKVGNANARKHFANELLVRYQARGLKLTDKGKIQGMAIIPKKGVGGTYIVSHEQIKALSDHTPKTAIFGMLSLIAYGVFFSNSWNTYLSKTSLTAKDQADFASAAFSTVGAFAGTVGKFIDAYTSKAAIDKIALGKTGPKMAKGLTSTFMSSQNAVRKLSIGGSLFGGIGGVIVAVVEVCNMVKEGKSGNWTLSALHFGVALTSGFVGVVSVRQAYVVYRGGDAALVRGAKLTFWFIIIAVVLSLWIEWIKRNDPDPLQKWLQDNGFNKGNIANAEKTLKALFAQVDQGGVTREEAIANYKETHGDID